MRVFRAEFEQLIRSMQLVFFISWTDLKARYRRTALGPFWLVFATLVGVGGLGFVWSRLSDVDANIFIPNLAVGLVSWYLISSCIIEAPSNFIRNKDLFLNLPVSSLVTSSILLLKNFINYFHNFFLIIGIFLFYEIPLNLNTLAFFPGLILLIINLFWIIHVLGYLGTRYRDIEPLVTSIMQPLFFLTPVLFSAEKLGGMAYIINFNPLTHLVYVVKKPLLGQAIPSLSWLVCIVMAIVGWMIAGLLIERKRSRLIYWIG